MITKLQKLYLLLGLDYSECPFLPLIHRMYIAAAETSTSVVDKGKWEMTLIGFDTKSYLAQMQFTSTNYQTKIVLNNIIITKRIFTCDKLFL